jgi:deoxyribose-phosphate aldolase
MIKNIGIKELAGMIDQTLLKPDITRQDLKRLCDESIKYGFKSVAVNGAAIRVCSEYLKNTNVGIVTGISYPLGQSALETKVFETRVNIKNGATEIDYVINIMELKNRNFNYIEKEMNDIVEVCRAANIISKVIFENFYLTDEEKKMLCEISLKIKPDFIKTSTGAVGGAVVEDVRLIKSIVGDKIKIKAAGGIRTLADALNFIEAGVVRIGTSSGPAIITEYSKILI